MLVEATAAKDPARFHRKGKNRPYRDGDGMPDATKSEL